MSHFKLQSALHALTFSSCCYLQVRHGKIISSCKFPPTKHYNKSHSVLEQKYFGAMLNPLGQSLFCHIFPELPFIRQYWQYRNTPRDPKPPTPTPSHCQGHGQGAMRTVPAAVPMFAHQQKTIQNQHLDCEFADGKGATE